MLRRLKIKNFTVFKQADLQFAPGLNVIVGENGSGKSHLLKLAYCVMGSLLKPKQVETYGKPNQQIVERGLANRLSLIFKPDHLGSLVHRQSDAKAYAAIEAGFSLSSLQTQFAFNRLSKTEVRVDSLPKRWVRLQPVYFPTRELLSICPHFVSYFEDSEIPFEGTWRDLCVLLGVPMLKRDKLSQNVMPILTSLEKLMGGKIIRKKDSEKFYLQVGTYRMESHLMAEGYRKIATLYRLLANGKLKEGATLFWDEPEANLNPKIIKDVASIILQLCVAGMQVVVASHSLFLLREMDILYRTQFANVKTRYLGLHPHAQGVKVKQGNSIDDIGTIDALREELSQSDRFMKSEEH